MTSEGVVVASVEEGSPAARAGLARKWRLERINGRPVRDVLELYFRESAARLVIDAVTPEGESRRIALRKPSDRPLGITLEPTRDLACKEQCVFCFVHQNPRGLRKPLYFKDDDYRLSFLHGNFVTLTHAPPGALERIIEQRLSPIYVSVHATDPVVRGRLLGNRGPAPILPMLERLCAAGIVVYAQVVLCPGWNDGEELARTLRELSPLHPSCAGVAVVPLGLTEHRGRLPSMEPFGRRHAEEALERLHELQVGFRAKLGTSFAFAADEIYLKASRPLPGRAHYEGYPMLEDGVGMWRSFSEGWRDRVRRMGPGDHPGRPVTLVTGRLFGPTMEKLVAELQRRTGADVRVVAARNLLFGDGITVAGLLSGASVLEALGPDGIRPEEVVLVPGTMINEGGTAGLTLDDLTLAGMTESLGVPVLSGGRTARDLFDVWRGLRSGLPARPVGRTA